MLKSCYADNADILYVCKMMSYLQHGIRYAKVRIQPCILLHVPAFPLNFLASHETVDCFVLPIYYALTLGDTAPDYENFREKITGSDVRIWLKNRTNAGLSFQSLENAIYLSLALYHT